LWAQFRKRKGAVRLHTVLDYDNCMPALMDLSDGKKHDVRAAQQMDFPADSIVLAGRAYVDFNRMREMDEAGG
jgi:hypothetical protein